MKVICIKYNISVENMETRGYKELLIGSGRDVDKNNQLAYLI